jgi:quercetin dioxygenase-like cupin family protein
MKRIVTNLDNEGRSIMVSEGEPPNVLIRGELRTKLCWATPAGASLPTPAGDPTDGMSKFEPPRGGSTFVFVEYPPNTIGRMHKTDTVDYVTVISGELWLVLEGGAETRLTAGDCVIQNGAIHRWDNRTSSSTLWVAALIGVAPAE